MEHPTSVGVAAHDLIKVVDAEATRVSRVREIQVLECPGCGTEVAMKRTDCACAVESDYLQASESDFLVRGDRGPGKVELGGLTISISKQPMLRSR